MSYLYLNASTLVMSGIGLMTMAVIFYCMWNKYSKIWKAVLVLCSIYSWFLGALTQVAGFVSIGCPELPVFLMRKGFQTYLMISIAILVLLWWIPWFAANWRKVYDFAKKSGYF